MKDYDGVRTIIDEYRKKNPGVSIEAAAKACGYPVGNYYRKNKEISRKKIAYAKVQAAPAAPTAKVSPPAVQAPDDAGKLFMIIGTPDQIRSMLK